MAQTFLSAGVYTSEQDFSSFASTVGITKLGLVGLTTKGPAFEPTKISSTNQYLSIFGTTLSDGSMQLPYVANSYLQQSNLLTVTRVLGAEGFVNSHAWIITASGGTHNGAILAVLRSKVPAEASQANPSNPGTWLNNNPNDIQISNITGALNAFTLSSATGSLSAYTNGVTVSLNETQSNYILNVLGQNPQLQTNDYGIYVESIFPHFVRQAVADGTIFTLNTALTFDNNATYTDYEVDSYTTSVTPMVVSNVVGNNVVDLFSFQSKCDGDSGNDDYKVSIMNINPFTNTFDVLVRNFNDTDASASQSAFESFRTLTLDPTQQNFIGAAIGTTDETYPSKSQYITVTMAPNAPTNSPALLVPAGFRGYSLRNDGISGTTAPAIYYKQFYSATDSPYQVFLGLSELAYTALTTANVGSKSSVKTLETDLFIYPGSVGSGMTTTKGFHMEPTAPSGTFITGILPISGYTLPQAKFTLVPYGGFDGFSRYEDPDFSDELAQTDPSNQNQMILAISAMSNSYEINMNLFALPGIDYNAYTNLVLNALQMVETRADSLYIIDAPRITDSFGKGTAVEAVQMLQDTGINSNYAATYWPWVQIKDTNFNKNIFVAPTLEICQAIALTDNISYPWFAPAGINRGTTQGVIKADVTLKKTDLDTLYVGLINPMATFQNGVIIWGQKTLQYNQTLLNRVNVRRLLLQVESLIAASSQALLFEQNDQTLIDQFLALVEPQLQQIQNNRGLNAFNIIMDASNNDFAANPNQLNGTIQIQPTATMEFLSITYAVFPNGASFSTT